MKFYDFPDRILGWFIDCITPYTTPYIGESHTSEFAKLRKNETGQRRREGEGT